MGLNAGLLTRPFKHLACTLVLGCFVRRAGAGVDVRIAREYVCKRDFPVPRKHVLGQCDRVAAALVLVHADDDLFEHLGSSWRFAGMERPYA
jgi:hypothetical protein